MSDSELDVIHVPDGFCDYVGAWDDDDLSDGAWWAFLEEGVASYNKWHETDIDLNDGVHAYLRSRKD